MLPFNLFARYRMKEKNIWQLYVDGGARNNPGPAGAGIVISKNNKLILSVGYFLGIKTNNQAEYLGLVIGLFFLVKKFHVQDTIHIFADSNLMVQQINAKFKVRNASLLQLRNLALQLLHNIDFKICHIPREENIYADEMVNHGIDTKRELPEEFKTWLNNALSPLIYQEQKK